MGFSYINHGDTARSTVAAYRVDVFYTPDGVTIGSGIRIDSTHAISARHLFEPVNGSYVSLIWRNISTPNSSAVSIPTELDGNYVPGTGLRSEQADDIALITFTAPAPYAPVGGYIGMGAYADGSWLTGTHITAYGYDAESSPEHFAVTDGIISSAGNGLVDPIPGTTQYLGMSGAGMITTAVTGEDYILGVMNYRIGNTNLTGGGAYLTPSDLTIVMNKLQADNPNADPNAMPRNYLFGSHVQDIALTGSYRRDFITGGNANETLSGGKGADAINGGAGNDVLYGGDDSDNLEGGDGADQLYGDLGSDIINGLAGDDFVQGAAGDDFVTGGLGQDYIYGGMGRDNLDGSDGDDNLFGNRDDDWLAGGAGADRFHFGLGFGKDTISDFSGVEGDRIVLDPGTSFTVSTSTSGYTLIDIGGGENLHLLSMPPSAFNQAWVVFS